MQLYCIWVLVGEKKKAALQKKKNRVECLGEQVERDWVSMYGQKNQPSITRRAASTGSGDSHPPVHLQDCTWSTISIFLHPSARMILTYWSKSIRGQTVWGLRYLLREDRMRELDVFKLKKSRLKWDFDKVYNYLIDYMKKTEIDHSQKCPVLG